MRVTTFVSRPLVVVAALVASLLGSVVAAPAANAGPGPFYKIVAEHSGKVLMPFNESKSSYTHIVQATDRNVGAQHWKVERWDKKQNTRVLRNRHSKLCLMVSANETLLRQAWCDTAVPSSSAGWRISNYEDMWSGRPILFQSRDTGNCMDVRAASIDDGAWVEHYPCHGSGNQQFRLVHVAGT